MDAPDRLDRAGLALVAALVFASGVAALLNQIAWQRVISLHAGVDLSSATTVVVAFLGGLGIGNLIGGRLAGRVSRTGALRVLGAAGLAEAAYSLISVWLLYDVYRSLASELEFLPLRIGFNIVVLLVPTTLMGLSLPLVARVIATDLTQVGSQVGRYYALNTLGAAFGAFAGGWVLLGTQGFPGVVRIAALIQAVTGMCFLGLSWSTVRAYSRRSVMVGPLLAMVLAGAIYAAVGSVVGQIDPLMRFERVASVLGAVVAFFAGIIAFVWNNASAVKAPVAPVVAPVGDGASRAAPDSPLARVPVRWWYLAYAATGAMALGFEQVFFRLIDAVMRSNAYTFAHVLSMYLGLLAVGTAIGSRVRRRVTNDRAAFLWIQFGVGVTAVLTLVVFTQVMPDSFLSSRFDQWFNSDGFAAGFDPARLQDGFIFGLVLPLWLMAMPVLLMGSAFPFVQGIVTDDLDHVGQRTGTLIFANLSGNVVGALLTSFVLIENFGTIGAYRFLLIPMALAGLAAALWSTPRVRPLRVGAVVLVVALGVVALPSNEQLWATLHRTKTDAIMVAEDRSCASAIEDYGDDNYQLTINGAGQNGYPFDDFHVLIGLLPTLMHPDPERGLAVGFGIGSTSYSMMASDRVGRVDSVELCGGHYELAQRLADRGVPEFVRLMEDPAHRRIIGDGRRHLLVTDEPYDVVAPDTLRPNAAGSGALYSLEFQELVNENLADDGVTVGWIPSYRVLAAASSTYPYVATLKVPSYNDSEFYLASRSPLELDRETLLERFDAMPDAALSPGQRADLRAFIATMEPECVNNGKRAPRPPTSDLENRDLRPRDEYFLTNGGIGEEQVPRTCGRATPEGGDDQADQGSGS